MIDFTQILIALFAFMGLLIPAYMKYSLDFKKMKASFALQKKEYETQNSKLVTAEKLNREYEIKISLFDRMMDFSAINSIKDSVLRAFQKTKADRFLILIAVNGKDDFNIVSVIFEQHRSMDEEYTAVGRYHNVSIDTHYKNILRDSEKEGHVEVHTETEKNSILKDFYEMEGVTHSIVKFLIRKPIDENNDFLVFSSMATHRNTPFTKKEITFINTEYNSSIKTALKKVLD